MAKPAKNIIKKLDEIIIYADQLKNMATGLRSELGSINSSAYPKGVKKVDPTKKANVLNCRKRNLLKKAS